MSFASIIEAKWFYVNSKKSRPPKSNKEQT